MQQERVEWREGSETEGNERKLKIIPQMKDDDVT